MFSVSASDHKDLLQSLNQQLLRSVDTPDNLTLPNPSVHIALRLSTQHNLAKESQHLNHLKTEFHGDIEKYGAYFHISFFILNFKATVNDLLIGPYSF